ncbi:non-ribosomal peptide synthetase [Nocardioides aurantiacus]|uniref:non-ribosomal peptide synthetase n=1 Tax=Nocardioides aurantiacus TaxID=86796 RepID=UPI00403F90AA
MTTLRGEPATGVRPLDRSPLGDLARFGGAPALVADGLVLSHADLAARVHDRAGRLGRTRRLVLLECRNEVETVVTYLAALAGHHPVLLTGPDCRRDDLVATYRPDVVAAGNQLEELSEPAHDLHPDLAVLLSTSGSTGSPKLVRLSRDNLRSNATSIADYLRLTSDDRAATTLPLQYCYGLSVLNSHLLVGASVLLTQRSVVEDEFWAEFGGARATSLAGVPHHFDLLDSSGFSDRDLPHLRTVTQAGGRLPAPTARRYAELGRERGFDLVMMYGQTEATARMAYLPPHLAAERPECIGIPVPGGSLRIEGDLGDGVGELVYAGDNVMLGYAEGPADLALGRTVHELRTGDLARQHEDGLFEVVGRRSRFLKLFGLRVDLDRLEQLAADDGRQVLALGTDDRLHLCVTSHRDAAWARASAGRLGLPPHVVETHVLASLPRTASGKPDRASLQRHVAAAPAVAPAAGDPVGEVSAARVRDLCAHLLGRPDAGETDSFVTLGGDSLSYVEVSLRLGQLLGDLPRDWATLSMRELAATTAAPRRRRWLRAVETPLVLRAVAIVLVIGTHANLLTVMGGAHVLLALVGYNLARFQLASPDRSGRRRSLLRAARNVAVPSALWIAGVGAVTGTYDVSTALLLNNLVGSDTWDLRWQFWFLEVVVWSLVGTAALVSVPALHRFERARPYAAALSLLAATAALRWGLVGLEAGPTERYALPVVLWCVALGWLAARARTSGARVVASVAAVVTCYGFFGDPVREALVAAGVAVLVWLPRLHLPAAAVPALSAIAASSLFTYLTHWQVYPHLEVDHPLLATLASFAVGLLGWRAYGALVPRTGAVVAALRAAGRGAVSTRRRTARR